MLLFFLFQVEPDFFDPEVLWDNFDREAAVKREVNSLEATALKARSPLGLSYVGNDYAVGNLGFFQNTYPGHYGYPASIGGSQVPNFLKVEQSGVRNNVASTESGSGTGIKLRTRQMHNQLDDTQFNQPDNTQSRQQGTAHRRIRLHMKMQVGPVECRMRSDSSEGAEIHEAVAEVKPVFSPKGFSLFLKLENILPSQTLKCEVSCWDCAG